MIYKFILPLLCTLLFSSCRQSFFLPPPITYNYAIVDGKKIFYRESGVKNKTTIVLLHGYPSSSHTYRYLIPMLSTHYHVIAPDNLGSGYSDHTNVDSLDYSFDLLARMNNELLKMLNVEQYVMYMQDFGAPVGYRMMSSDPSRIKALIVQNANAYMEGLTPQRQQFFKSAHDDRSVTKIESLYELTSKESIVNKQYLFDIALDSIHIQSPDAWTHDLYFLNSYNDRMIQVKLFQDYLNNLTSYPDWQAMLKNLQPKTLIVWGEKDQKFNKNGAIAYLTDLPNAELHLIAAGHFAVEEKPTQIASLILNFLRKNKIN